MLVEFVENRLTENHVVLVTHDRPVGAVMVILPGGEPLADLLVGELLVSAGQAHGLGFCQHRSVGIEVLASQEFKADAGTGQDRLVRRLEDKAPGRVEKVKPHYTSQRCSACGQVDRDSRESQAVFRCTACGFAANADVNAAINIAAGHAVTARGDDGAARPVNREPHLLLQSA